MVKLTNLPKDTKYIIVQSNQNLTIGLAWVTTQNVLETSMF